MKKYVKSFLIVVFNNACLLMLLTMIKDLIKGYETWEFINTLIISLFYLISFFLLVVEVGADLKELQLGMRYTELPNDDNEDLDLLSYSFVDNSILLNTKTVNKNGFYEVWRQESKEHSIQILCFNPETEQFQAFDRFQWMDEPRIVLNPPAWYEENGVKIHCDSLEPDGVYYNKDLWTPIKLHYTVDWLKKHVVNSINKNLERN